MPPNARLSPAELAEVERQLTILPTGETATASFYFRSQAAGTPTITASASGFSPAMQTETIFAGAPTALAFATVPQIVAAGTGSSVTSVQARDGFGNPSSVVVATTLNLVSSSPSLQFFANATLVAPVTSVGCT